MNAIDIFNRETTMYFVGHDELTRNGVDQYCYEGHPFNGVAKDDLGRCHHYRLGRLHREDGPAIEYPDGSEEWHLNGEIHREDGPALIDTFLNLVQYRQNGKKHREDGPAVIEEGAPPEWWLFGEKHTMESWAKCVGIYDTDEFTMMKLEWG